MKKLFLISVTCMALQYTGSAQNARLGITAGTVFSNYSISAEGITIKGKSRTGLTAGVLADIPIGKSLSFQPAVNFVQYGTTFEEVSGDYTATDKVKINSIEIPLNVLYNLPAGKGRFFVGAGPSLSFHLSGKRNSYDSENGNQPEVTLKFGSNADADMKSLNIGANFTAGYVFTNGLFISACFNAGLSNLEPDSEDASTKSHYFGIRIGFLLSGDK
jgi:hypothetical protein